MKTNQTVKTGILYRHSAIEKRNEEGHHENRSFELSFSSEEPVERFFGFEVLDHKAGSVRLDWLRSGRAPLLLDHDQTKQIGVVETAAISPDGKARARIRFGKGELAESAYKDVLDGIKGNISVGYRYLQDGVTLEKEAKGGKPATYRITAWEPLEISLVSIPADHTVGIGRSNEEQTIFNVRSNFMQTETNDRNIENKNHAVEAVKPDIGFNPEQVRRDEQARVAEIIALGDRHNMRDAAMEFIREGRSIDAFRQKVLEALGNNPVINTTSPETAIIGMNEKEARSFSILRAIKAAATGNWSDAELEREASTAVAKRIGREPASFFVPLDVQQRSFGTRTLEKLSNVAGGYLVDTEYLSNNFIELLRNKMLVNQMGAKVMSGLHGDIAIPKQTGGATTFWISEGRTPEHSGQTFGQVTLSPKSIAAYTDFTRKLVLQSSPDIENLVRNDLATVIALEIDRAAICGNGIGAEPLGILSTAGISEIKFDDHNPIDWPKIVKLESEIAAKNADIGTLGYLCNAAMRGLLKSTEKSQHTAEYLWESRGAESGFGFLNGYRVGTTNQIPADTLLFGNFADLIIGQWGVLDVLVDPYTLGTSGSIRIRVMQDVDVAIRHSESFAVLRK